MALRTILTDPMLRMLALATALAAIVPVTGGGRDIAQIVANCAVFLLFLLNGLRIARSEIVRGIAHWRYQAVLVVWVFGAMALGGLALSLVGEAYLPALIALGFLYLGVLPSTVQSATSYTALAGGAVALAVVSAALLNILGVFVSVPLFLALGGSGEGAVGSEVLVKILGILVLPFALGQIFQKPAAPLIESIKGKIAWVDRFVIAIAVYVAFSGAVEQGIWSRVDGAGWLILLAFVALFLAFAHGGAYTVAKLAGFAREDRIAFLFSGAQKSAAVGAPLATILFPPDAAGFIVLPLLLYHLFQLVLAAPLASRLSASRLPDGAGYSAPTTRS
ncbi:bile acid:sodium symporter [Qipengyuania sp. XHP0211]|uniref:bile acid:sodium symporter n=1 Tax=Qipengyuania sp. XHP0211 TaxID=3038079 RepID=UPI00241D5900|nr:bile acid:sodium symporter [Qipengyuania sp. XHP0211]MDG5749513.1 bile acid:sodium symporter [Qipengyuania sp. XHP0211]